MPKNFDDLEIYDIIGLHRGIPFITIREDGSFYMSSALIRAAGIELVNKFYDLGFYKE